jgi:hypothetical protein
MENYGLTRSLRHGVISYQVKLAASILLSLVYRNISARASRGFIVYDHSAGDIQVDRILNPWVEKDLNGMRDTRRASHD